MKVIHLISGGDSGGAKTHVLSLLTELNKQIEADLVCFMSGDFSREAQELGIPLTVMEKNFLSSVKRVKQRIKTGGYDLVHCHGSRANLIGAMIKPSVKIPVISTVHSDYRLDYMGRPGAAATYGKLNALSLRRLDYRVCVSDEMRNTLIRRGFAPNRLFPIYNGIDFTKTIAKTDRAAYFAKIGCPFAEDAVIAGIAARLDPVKDVATLIRGFALASKDCPELRLMIAGDGQEMEKLRELAGELGVAERVFFAGWVTDMPSFYGALDINTLTSVSETFPYAVTEGARAKLPTISSAVGGVPMLVKQGKTGFLFEPGDCEALAQALKKLALDEDLRVQLGQAIYEKGAAEFSTQTTCRTQLDIYKTVLEREKLRREGGKNGVVICGAYGHGNSGDEAILEAIVGQMRSIDKYMPITVISRKPSETQVLRGVNSVYRFNYPKFRREMKRAKLYINGGGSLIQNVTSRRSLSYYLYTIKVAKSVGCRVIMYGCGIGPVRIATDISRAAAVINQNVDIITLREPNSLEELKRFGIYKPEIILSSDPALDLPSAEPWEVDAFFHANGLDPEGSYICFALRKWSGFDERVPDFANAAMYAYNQLGLIPVFISINHLDDLRSAAQVTERMGETPYHIITSSMTSGMTIGVMGKMRVVVSMRLHGLIFAAGQGVPLVGVSYDPKVTAFLDYIGGYPCMSLYEASAEKLISAINSAARRSEDRQSGLDAAQRLKEIEKKNVEAARKLLNS